MTIKIIWYDLEGEKATDIIENVSSTDEAISKAFVKYNGNPPAKLYTPVVVG